MPQPLREVDVWLLVLCPLIVPCAGACASSDFAEVSAGPVEGEDGDVFLTSARISWTHSEAPLEEDGSQTPPLFNLELQGSRARGGFDQGLNAQEVVSLGSQAFRRAE